MSWNDKEAKFSVPAEREAFVRLDAFKKLIALIEKETQHPVFMTVVPRPSGDSFKVYCYFKSFTSEIHFGDQISQKATPEQLVGRYAMRAYLWPKKKVACQVEVNAYIELTEKRVSNVHINDRTSWYEGPIEEAIAAIPGAVQRLVEAQEKAIEYLASGALRRKKKDFLIKKHGRKVRSELIAALEVGLEKDDIIDLLNEAVVQSVLES